MGELTSAKLDELDKRLSGTLAEQSQRTEVQLSALSDERRAAADGFTSALDDFNAAMASQMGVELLRISQAELEYHQGMVAHLQQLVGSLQAQRPRDAAGLPADYLRKPPSPTFAPPERAPFEATSASDLLASAAVALGLAALPTPNAAAAAAAAAAGGGDDRSVARAG